MIHSDSPPTAVIDSDSSPTAIIHSSPLKYTSELRNLLFQNISKITSPSQDSSLSTSNGDTTGSMLMSYPNSIVNSSVDSLSHCKPVDEVDSASAKRKLTFVSKPDNANSSTAVATKASNTSEDNATCSSSDIEYSTTEVTLNDHKSHSSSESSDGVLIVSVDVSSQQSNPSLSSEKSSNTSSNDITQNLCVEGKDDSIERIHFNEAPFDPSLTASQPPVDDGAIIPSYQQSNALSCVTTSPIPFTVLNESTNHFPSLDVNPDYNIPTPILPTYGVPLYLPCVPFVCAYMYDSNGCFNCPELGSGARIFPGSARVYRDGCSPHGMIVLLIVNTSHALTKSEYCEEVFDEECDKVRNDASSVVIANDVESLVANKKTCSEDCVDNNSSQDIETTTPPSRVIPDLAHLSNDVLAIEEGCEAALSCCNVAISEQEVSVVCEEDEHALLHDNELISFEAEVIPIDGSRQDEVIEQATEASQSNESINSEDHCFNHSAMESSRKSSSNVSDDVTCQQLFCSTSSSINRSNDVIPSQELTNDIPEGNTHVVNESSSMVNGDVHTMMECDYENGSLYYDSHSSMDKICDDIEEESNVLDCSNELLSTENSLDSVSKCEISPQINGVKTPPKQDNECLSHSDNNASPVLALAGTDVRGEKVKQVFEDDVIDLLLEGLAPSISDCSDYSDSEDTIVPPPPDFGDDVMVACDSVNELKGIEMDQNMPMDISTCSPSPEKGWCIL